MLQITISKPIHQLGIPANTDIIIDYDEDNLSELFKDIEKNQLKIYHNESIEIIDYKLNIEDLFDKEAESFFEELEELKDNE